MSQLPEFRLHGFDSKFAPLTANDTTLSPHAAHYIKVLLELIPNIRSMTILDLGCGRGELVNALRTIGSRAFGIEIDARFVESGNILNEWYHDELPLLSTVDETGRSIFQDGFFDLVISDQVLEHVRDLDGVALEVARVLKSGGKTVHQFPAHLLVTEPHYHMPFVHWLPKSQVRLSAIKRLLGLGCSARYFPEYPLDDRAKIIYDYSIDETFYRRRSVVEQTFENYGIHSNGLEAIDVLINQRIGFNLPLLSVFIDNFRNTIYYGTKK